MAMLRLLISLAAITVVVGSAMAENHTVGGPNGGWDQSTNLQSWASSKTFTVGDNLIFTYSPLHDVNEVSKADYDSCQTTSPMSSNSGGNTVIPLANPGKKYFICGTMGHCSQGMKLEVNVLAAATPPPSTTPSLAPSASTTPSAATAPAPAPMQSSSEAQSPSTPAPEMGPAASPSEATVQSPALSPVDPSTTDDAAASPPALDFPTGISPWAGGAHDSLPTPPSSANRITAIAGSAAGFGVLFMMLAL